MAFDDGDVRQACKQAGILYDPADDLLPSDVYLQIVRPGVIALPQRFEVEPVARFGRLTLVMPPPAIIAASKLVRSDDRDLYDVAWWLRQRALELADIEEAISMLPREIDRQTATENLVVVRFVEGKPQ